MFDAIVKKKDAMTRLGLTAHAYRMAIESGELKRVLPAQGHPYHTESMIREYGERLYQAAHPAGVTLSAIHIERLRA
jgi:hypothetical protein